VRLWRHESESLNFGMYLSGRTISVLFSSVYTFAVGLYVLKMTGSGLSFAITLSLQILPTVLLGPFAGVLADRLDKKIMVVATDAFSGLVFIVLFLISQRGLSLPSIYTATLLISISQTLYNICIDSAVPNIVSKDNILKLNSIGKIIDSTASIISPGLGGILCALVDMRFFIFSNGIAFLLSTLTECFINFNLYLKPADSNVIINVKKDLAEGIRYISKTSWMKNSLINFSMFNFFMALCYSVPVPYILNNLYKLSAKNYGIVQCFMPTGMIIGALLVKKITEKIQYGRLMVITGVLLSACMFLVGILPVFNVQMSPFVTVPYYGVLLFCFGIIVALIDIPFINNFQTRVPDSIRGRALSISISAIKVVTPICYILSGVMIGLIPSFYLPLGGSALLLLSIFCCTKSLLKLNHKHYF
jgi:MFS family permease